MLSTEALSKHFDGIVATESLSFAVARGDIHAVIGPNGAGKTTLIAQLSGLLRPDSGTIRFDGQEITRLKAPARALCGLSRSFQITSVLGDFTALQNVALAVQAHQGHSFRFWRRAAGDPLLTEPAFAALRDVGLDARAGTAAADLSHGEHRLLEIAMALAGHPKMLLLDEPLAGMGPEESERMTSFLRSMRGRVTMLLVEHDMEAVFALADRITVLVNGCAIAEGTPDEIRGNRQVRSAYLGEEAAV